MKSDVNLLPFDDTQQTKRIYWIFTVQKLYFDGPAQSLLSLSASGLPLRPQFYGFEVATNDIELHLTLQLAGFLERLFFAG